MQPTHHYGGPERGRHPHKAARPLARVNSAQHPHQWNAPGGGMRKTSKAAAKASPARKDSPPGAKRGEGAVSAPKRMGRPPVGKHSNPAYMQTTLWLPRDLMTEGKIKL